MSNNPYDEDDPGWYGDEPPDGPTPDDIDESRSGESTIVCPKPSEPDPDPF